MAREAAAARGSRSAIDDRGEVDASRTSQRLLSPRTRAWSPSRTSRTPSARSIPVERDRRARSRPAGALVLVDGAQSVPHLPVDVAALGCDFFAFSGHKTLRARPASACCGRGGELLAAMPPWQSGGGMIRSVTFEKHHLRRAAGALRGRHAGRRPEATGLAVALDWLERRRAGAAVAACEQELPGYALAVDGWPRMPGLRMSARRARAPGSLSFVIEGVHPHDVGTVLDPRASRCASATTARSR